MKRPSTSSSADGGGGFNLLPLPPAPPPSYSKLRRSSSLPVDPAGAPSPDSTTHLPSPQRQRLPLLRTVSDPIPFLSHCSPPNPNPNPNQNHMLSAGPRVGSRSPASGSESPASKRLKRMSERMKEMKQWFDQLIQQSEDCDSETDDDEAEDIHGNKNVELEEDYEEQENTVSADRQGDAINIRFKCPCGDSYHILLLGQDYYCKLL